MFSSPFSYWAWAGTLYLVWLTIQDYRNNMLVDDRKNWFMMGLSVSITSHIPLKLWYLFALAGFLAVFQILGRKLNAFGEGDLNSLSWVFLGLGLISVYKLVVFVIIFSVITLIYQGLKVYVFKYKWPTPFYGVILLSYVVSMILLRLY